VGMNHTFVEDEIRQMVKGHYGVTPSVRRAETRHAVCHGCGRQSEVSERVYWYKGDMVHSVKFRYCEGCRVAIYGNEESAPAWSLGVGLV